MEELGCVSRLISELCCFSRLFKTSYFFVNTDKSLREKLALDILEWAPIESKVYFIMINVCFLKLI